MALYTRTKQSEKLTECVEDMNLSMYCMSAGSFLLCGISENARTQWDITVRVSS